MYIYILIERFPCYILFYSVCTLESALRALIELAIDRHLLINISKQPPSEIGIGSLPQQFGLLPAYSELLLHK